MKIAHILAATDLSDEMRSRAPAVSALARQLGARITLLHVVAGHDAIPHGAPLAPPITEPTDPGSMETAREKIQERLSLYGEDVDITTDVIAAGEVPRAIVEYAEEHGVDLIAMATHGRTGFKHMVLGSVAEGVVRRSTVPVLVVPRPE